MSLCSLSFCITSPRADFSSETSGKKRITNKRRMDYRFRSLACSNAPTCPSFCLNYSICECMEVHFFNTCTNKLVSSWVELKAEKHSSRPLTMSNRSKGLTRLKLSLPIEYSNKMLVIHGGSSQIFAIIRETNIFYSIYERRRNQNFLF